MASPKAANLLNGVIDYSNSKATLKLDGPEVSGLYGYRTLLPSEREATSPTERAFLGVPQLAIFFTSKKSDITAKDFKANAQATIDIELKIVGKSTLEKFVYQLICEICSIQSLPKILGKDHYCYKLIVGQPTVALKSLETSGPKIYRGTVAEVITAVCTDNGLTEKQFDVSHIKNLRLVRDYLQKGQSWAFIRDDILRVNGLVAFLNEANQLIFAADPSLYTPTDYPTLGTIYPMPQQTTTSQNITGIFEFSAVEPMLHEQGVKVNSSTIESLNNRKQVQGSFAENSALVSTFHLPGEKNEENNALAERLHQSLQSVTRYSGVATFPLRLAETMDLEWTKIDGTQQIAALVVTEFTEIVCSFFMAAPVNNPAAIDHTAWTGLPPQTIRYRFNAVPKTFLPRLPYIEPSLKRLDGIIVGADGKLDSTQPTFKNNQLYVGLVSLFRKTPLDTFAANQLVLANSGEPFVLQNSAPFAGRLVYVWYDPLFGTFTIQDAYRTAAFDDKTVIQTVNPRAKIAPPQLTIMDANESITATTAQLTVTAARAVTLTTQVEGKESAMSLNATGVTVDTKADMQLKANNYTQNVKNKKSTYCKDLSEDIQNMLQTTAKDIDAQATGALAMIGKRAQYNKAKDNKGTPSRTPKAAPAA
jgi:hypothetical protein